MAPETPFADRLHRMRAQVADRGCAAAVLTPGPDLEYLLGRSVSSHERLSCLVIPAAGEPALLVPELERLGWSGSPAEAELRILTWLDGQDPYRMIADMLTDAPGPLAVGDSMPAGHALRIQQAQSERSAAAVPAPGPYPATLASTRPTGGLTLAGPAVAALRVAKSAAEIDALAAAGAAIDRVQQRIGEWLMPGRSEFEVAADIAAAIVAEGHQRADFVIVGSGPNGASPHHEASERVVQPGDVVVIDIGGPHLTGYFSDCTRTYQVAGTADPEFAIVYDVVRCAQQAGVDAVRAGVRASEVDAAARRVIEDAGYGPYFITRTGHGIGLEVHEEPYLVTGNDTALQDGMTFSVEPGIYLPGRFGVRIEDIVAVDAGGVRRLNNCPRDLTVV